ncbi:MAG: PAS domain-containing protein [bacterium]|nr:PAS domain-containing protein [bacterium]
MTDLSVKNKALQELKRQLEAYQDHLVITDIDSVILYANPAAQKHTGFLREEMIGKKPSQLWGGTNAKRIL